MMRLVPALLMLLVTSSETLAEDAKPKVKLGEIIYITLEQEAAELYSRCSGRPDAPRVAGRQIQILGMVHDVRKDGTVVIEHSLERQSPARMVTLRGSIDAASLHTAVTPKGTAVYSSPGSRDAVLTKEETTSHRLAIKDLKGFKLRAWTIEKEFGDETAEAEAIVPVQYRLNGPWRN